MPPRVIYVEGLIGAGKSSFLRELSRRCDHKTTRCIYEPIHEWEESGMLKLFYSDMKRWAYTFQAYVFTSRINAIIKFRESMTDDEYGSLNKIYVERSVFSDKFFFMENLSRDGMVSTIEMDVYREWWDMWSRLLPAEFTFPRCEFIYLRPCMEVVMERVKKRARDGEASVDEKYQLDLERCHDTFFKSSLSPPLKGVDPDTGAVFIYGVLTIPGYEQTTSCPFTVVHYNHDVKHIVGNFL